MEFAEAVVQFNKEILDIPQRSPASLISTELMHGIKCLDEELREFCDSAEQDDYIGQIDALIDLMYFATGILYKLGLTPAQIHQCQMAVHDANMTKKKGTVAKRNTGAPDAVKPEDWIAPEARIAKILLG